MVALIALALCSFALSFVLTPLVRDVALRFGCLDRPDNARKLHRVPVPRIGGVAIMLAYVAAAGLLLLAPWEDGRRATEALLQIRRLLPSVVLIFSLGLLDDIFGLKPWQKLAGQVAAAGVACWEGVRVQGVIGYAIDDLWSVAITIVWLVGCANALNLLDGVDGLAAGVAIFATATTLVSALINGHTALVLATVPLAGALLGFLRYNFSPASIFLGDSGSLTVGFLLGCYGVIWSHKATTLLAMTAPLMAFSIPLLDAGLAVARRFLCSRPIFGADRGHIHHRLLERGLTPRGVALLLYGASGLAAAFALLLNTARAEYSALVVLVFCGAVWFGIQSLGFVEFRLARSLARPRTFRNILAAQIQLNNFESALSRAGSVEDCWAALRTTSLELGFTRVRLELVAGTFTEVYNGAARGYLWTMRVPLSRSEFVELGHEFQTSNEPMPIVTAPLADAIRRALAPKVAALQGARGKSPETYAATR